MLPSRMNRYIMADVLSSECIDVNRSSIDQVRPEQAIRPRRMEPIESVEIMINLMELMPRQAQQVKFLK